MACARSTGSYYIVPFFILTSFGVSRASAPRIPRRLLSMSDLLLMVTAAERGVAGVMFLSSVGEAPGTRAVVGVRSGVFKWQFTGLVT